MADSSLRGANAGVFAVGVTELVGTIALTAFAGPELLAAESLVEGYEAASAIAGAMIHGTTSVVLGGVGMISGRDKEMLELREIADDPFGFELSTLAPQIAGARDAVNTLRTIKELMTSKNPVARVHAAADLATTQFTKQAGAGPRDGVFKESEAVRDEARPGRATETSTDRPADASPDRGSPSPETSRDPFGPPSVGITP